MEWSNDKVFEFLKLYQTEPSLWDPRLPAHKSRSAHSEAWRRIIQALSFPMTQRQLKNKKDSLMGYYRIHLNKYKKSIKSEEEDVYRTNWFAFDEMDSFLRPIYGTNTLITTESADEEYSTDKSATNSPQEVPENRPRPIPSTSAGHSSNTGRKSTSTTNRPTTFKRLHIQYQKPKNEAFSQRAKAIMKKEEMDEYDHFAYLIAFKIRKIQNMDDREMLMNSIQNLTFEYYMKNK